MEENWRYPLVPRFFVFGLVPSAALAQSENAAADDTSIKDIVVTAQKRAQSVMDVGATLNVLSADNLAKQRVFKGEDLAIAVPSLTFARSDYNVPIFSIRGVGFNDNALGVYPAVSFYIDEAPLVFPVLAANATFDLQRIEVLKGPQGTLFGQNATGGAINMIANKPTKELDAGGSMTYGRFNLFEASGHVSGPITDTLRGRVAFMTHTMDPWQISATRPDDRNGREQYYTGRGILEWEPSSDFKAIVTVNAWKDKSQPQALALIATKYAYTRFLDTPTGNVVLTQPLISGDPRLADWGGPQGPSTDPFVAATTPTRLFTDRDFAQGVLRLEYRPSADLQLTSLSSYVSFQQHMGASRSGSAAQNEDQTKMYGRVSSFSQELRLESAGATQYHWVIGANYESSKIKENQLQSNVNNTSAIHSNIFQEIIDDHSDIENWALFGNAEYKVLPQLNFKGGIRYTHSRNRYYDCDTDAGDGNIANIFNLIGSLYGSAPFTPIGTGPGQCFTTNKFNVPGTPFNQTLTEHNVSWQVGLDYHANRDILIYGNVSKGYKAGSFPTSAPANWSGLQPVTQESVLAYELGLKSELLDRRLQINAATFIYDYRNKQIHGSIFDSLWGVLPQLRNIPKSRVHGAELEITTQPVNGLRVTGSVVYLDTKIVQISPLEYTVIGTQKDMTGSPLPLTPKWSYKLDGEYTWDVGNVHPFIGATWRWVGKEDANLDGSNIPVPLTDNEGLPAHNRYLPGYQNPFVIGSYGLLSGRIGVSGPEDRWSVSLWCDNCLNQYYWLNVTVSQDNISRGVGRSSSYGLTASFKY